MVLDLLAEPAFLRGLLWATAGVLFWVAGFPIAYYAWKRYRIEE